MRMRVGNDRKVLYLIDQLSLQHKNLTRVIDMCMTIKAGVGEQMDNIK